MTGHHYLQLDEINYPKKVRFIQELMRSGVDIEHIDTNDWQCNLKPSVYVHKKGSLFQVRRYSRCSSTDVKKALKFYNSTKERVKQ